MVTSHKSKNVKINNTLQGWYYVKDVLRNQTWQEPIKQDRNSGQLFPPCWDQSALCSVATSRVSRWKEKKCHDWCLKKQNINMAGQGQPILNAWPVPRFKNPTYGIWKDLQWKVNWILHTSQVAHQDEAYFGFCSIKWLGVFSLPPGWNVSPSQDYP